jgi:hypothetical protein
MGLVGLTQLPDAHRDRQQHVELTLIRFTPRSCTTKRPAANATLHARVTEPFAYGSSV